ncbi:diacylglycerol O-acyltransferase 2 like 3 [Linderina pennispora]|uniref:Diacylglycerol O-acyltransferase n=1 Tax=Linderina pennispora TaxID=61395 RepID=A0A1Y1W6U4_9FUNG|nr:diacylglycerol O-acyltransferase 2 like 3 [Linderina pennispora]ORX69241.1 diacylglycerol O-acyltransferase 2 like 3 [Linderina pennispora]
MGKAAREITPEELGPGTKRWLQTVVVTLFGMSIVVCPLFYLLLYAVAPWLWPVLLMYGAFCVVDPGVEDGIGRRREWIRVLRVWDYLVDYFEPRIVSEATLDPGKRYIMCVVAGAKKVGFDRAYPGITVHPAVLPITLRIPFFGEYLLSMGAISSSRDSIRKCLARGGGHMPGIIIGGAQESLRTDTKVTTLVLRNRKGFVREALLAGADLVPVFVFNENKIYKQMANPPGSLLYRVQRLFQRYAHFAVPAFYGKNGFTPFKTPITFVAGEPIAVDQTKAPTGQDIDRYHAQYLEALTDLWTRYHAKYDGEAERLDII